MVVLAIGVVLLGIDARECPKGLLAPSLALISHPVK
jgi:hypothetical protein